MAKKMLGWRRVKPDAAWGCRGGRACGSIPRRAYVTRRRDGSLNAKRYCVAHAKKHGCKV